MNVANGAFPNYYYHSKRGNPVCCNTLQPKGVKNYIGTSASFVELLKHYIKVFESWKGEMRGKERKVHGLVLTNKQPDWLPGALANCN